MGLTAIWRHRRAMAVLALAVGFAAGGVTLARHTEGKLLAAHAAAFLALGVAVSVFAVNFSFLAFQLSPYRSLVRRISPRHLVAALVLLVAALVPLAGFASGNRRAGELAIGMIPLLAYGSFLLALLGQREADPAVLVERRLSPRALRRFFDSFAKAIRAELRRRGETKDETDETSAGVPPPMHEVFYRTPPPPQADDPLEFLVRVANAAIANDDTYTFAAAVKRGIGITREVEARQESDDDIAGYKVKAALESHARAALERIGRAATEDKVPEEFAERFVIACGEYLEEAADLRQEGKEPTLRTLAAAAGVAKELVKRGATGAPVGLLVVARRVAERGMEELADTNFDRYYLAGYPSQVEGLGKAAVAARNAEFLYRCFDTLCWMGCAAVRLDAGDAGRASLQALVQLGREARAAELECFYTRCALTPADHVDERLGWVATWVAHSPEKSDHWLASLGSAFSRLSGYRCELTFDESGEKPELKLVKSDKPHTETIDDMGRVRTVDYSDFSVTKELHLY